MSLRRLPLWAAALAAALAAPAAAQITPVTVPKGQLRFDFDGEFRSWDWRWHDGSREEWAARFDRPTLDRTVLPGLRAADSLLRRITGIQDVTLSAGKTEAAALVNFGTIGFGGSLGVTSRLTLFTRVPFVQAQVRPHFGFDGSSATAGLAAADANQLLMGQLGTALSDLSQQISSGAFDGDPAQKALAQQTLAQGTALQSDLGTLLGGAPDTPFAPLASSPEGIATLAAVDGLRTALEGLGIASLTASAVLPAEGLTSDQFDAFTTDPDGPLAIRPITELPILSYIGDIELGAAYALVDRFPASRYGAGVRAVIRGTVRLPTAQEPNPDRLLGIGTGDHQPDLQVDLVTDFASGRLGARLEAGYNLQLAANQTRRVAPIDDPFPAKTTLALVRRDPGDEWWIGAQPFVRLATYLSLSGAVHYYRRGVDRYEYAAGQTPIAGVGADVLAAGSRQGALLMGGALSYAHSGLDKRGQQKLPLEASLRYQRIVRSHQGILPDANQVLLSLKFYTRLWQ